MRIIKNYLYNLVGQVLFVILPFITMPYLARVIGVEGFGLVAFTESIMRYFFLIASIGILTYGNRAIAYVRDNKQDRSRVFWEIFYLQTITSIIAILLYFCVIFIFHLKNHFLLLMQSIYLIANIFDISWFFMGIEDFKKTVSRSFIAKICSVVLIFAFVKTESDVWKFVLIYALTTLISNIAMWTFLFKYVDFKKVDFSGIKSHLFPALSLFISQIAVTVYFVLDRTMIGVLTDHSQVGLYDTSMKIIRIPLAFLTSLSLVMLPRMSNMFAKGEISQIKEYTNKSFDFLTCMGLPFLAGIIAILPEFVPWFLGKNFTGTILIITIISPILMTMAWGSITGSQLLIPMGREKIYTLSLITAAVVNLILNFLLIPKFQAIGACIAISCTEVTVIIIHYFALKNFLSIKAIFEESWKYLLGSILIYISVRIAGTLLGIGIFTTIIQIITGIFVYFTTLFILKSKTLFILLNIIKTKFNKNFDENELKMS